MARDSMAVAIHERRLQVGVELQRRGGVHARVWAPARREVALVKDGETDGVRLDPEGDGFFSGAAGLAAGDRYWFRLDGELLRPDPASRFQPEGPHGPSQVVDPDAFTWTDHGWGGVERHGQVLYEMHVGTFTPTGTWAAAAEELEELARLGITVIEMMPVNDFAGRFGWGYDGVNLYAPTRLYGTPDDLRRFVDRAHALGLGVILDVVYNHLGPDGNYLADFSPDYFTTRYRNDWGQAINFEGPAPAREYFVANAGYWIEEFHVDGLRVDATQDMHDASDEHVLAAIARRARQAGAPRRIFLVGENEPQETRLVRPPADGGYGFDALWNDDYHHTAVVALTGRREAYYLDYTGSPQELISCAKYGFLYQGQWYSWQKQRRGTAALDLPHAACVTFLENHDQVANSAFGRRLHQSASPARYRALTALTLLGPGTPMLFQGQEFASSKPFLYFADHRPELREPIRKGRAAFLAQFSSMQDPEVREALPEPGDEDTFRRCTLDRAERTAHAEAYALHRDLLALRHGDATLTRPGRVDGALVALEAFVVRLFGGDGDRLLLVNLGRDLDLRPAPEPLLAPPPGQRWRLAWSSESVQYGGSGTPAIRPDAEWHIPGETALLLRPLPHGEADPGNGETEDDDA
jgi:maltooligosyltrehalose trehalohydrolase